VRAVLYAVGLGDTWQWHVSLDFHADRYVWSGLQQRDVRMLLRFEPAFSFGQAYTIRQKLVRLDWSGLKAEQVVDKVAKENGFGLLPDKIQQQLEWIAEKPGFMDKENRADFLDQAEWERMLRLLSGRSLLIEELQRLLTDHGLHKAAGNAALYVQYAYLSGELQWSSGTISTAVRRFPGFRTQAENRCARCGSDRLHWTDCIRCGTLCPYCEDCLTMGRTRFCSLIVRRPEALYVPDREPETSFDQETVAAHLNPWGLSPAQFAASAEGIRFLSGIPKKRRGDTEEAACFLIWAVTGAGKTEMIFPLIDFELRRGGKVCVATPRRDVVLELMPRIEKAFPGRRVVTLYGGSGQRWEQGEVTIATTHQLLRFHRAFDLIILDELDAFPFHNNPMLEHAAKNACKTGGRYIFLSATPPAHMQKAAKSGRLPHAKVPVRFHRHPLPVPVILKTVPLEKLLRTGNIPPALSACLRRSIERGAQSFLFVPAIKLVDPFVKLLRQVFPHLTIEGTSSRDPERALKVRQFREGAIRLLVTTTILERGVTVPKTDVFIFDAGSEMFDEASLVQMSGRAGRSKEDPAGSVVFVSEGKTSSQVKAIRHIKAMNRLARRKGYLIRPDGVRSHWWR